MRRIGIGVAGLLLAYVLVNWLGQAIELRSISSAMAADETAKKIGSGPNGYVFVVCSNAAPRRLVVSWVMPERNFLADNESITDAQLSAYHWSPRASETARLPPLKLSKGRWRELLSSGPLDASILSKISSVLAKTDDWSYSLDGAERGFGFHLVGRARDGLAAVCTT